MTDTTRSNEPSRELDLERGLPTTAEDVGALRRARQLDPLDLAGYLRFLAALPALSDDALKSKRCPTGDQPFQLPD